MVIYKMAGCWRGKEQSWFFVWLKCVRVWEDWMIGVECFETQKTWRSQKHVIMLVVQALELLSLIFQFTMYMHIYIYIYGHHYYIVVLLYSFIVTSATITIIIIIIIIIIIMLYNNASYSYRIIYMYGTNLPVQQRTSSALDLKRTMEVPILRPYFLWGHRSGTLRFFMNSTY